MTVMFSLPNDNDEATYSSYSPTPVSDYGGESRSGSQSPGLSDNAAGPSATAPSLRSTKNSRKRRAQLSPINFANPAPNAEADELSNDSPTSSNHVSDEETHKHKPRAISSTSDPLEKRSRLTSSSSTSSSLSLPSLVSYGSQLSLRSVDSYCDLNDLEQTAPSVKSQPPIRGGTKLIVDNEFELIGSGQECKAVHIASRIIYHCTAIHLDDYKTFMAVYDRIESAKNKLTASELRELKRMLMPEGIRVCKAEAPKTWYVISPDHQGSLHTFYNTESPSAISRNHSPWTEQESKTIFRQIVRLVTYCHQIGIYFGDFRLQKLVYTNKKNSLIRVLHLRNIHVAPTFKDNTIQKPSQRVCPAYLPPELLRYDKPYSATAADIWTLGVLLFVLLTGRFPFVATKPTHLARLIRSGNWSFRATDRLTRSARLLVYSLIRQNPHERPLAKEILACDWLQNQSSEPVQSGCVTSQFPSVTVHLAVPETGRLSEANPRIPHQLLSILMQRADERNSIYNTRSNIRASMESFAGALHRNTNGPFGDGADQVVPEQPAPMNLTNIERDMLGITVVRVQARRNAGTAR